MKVSVISGDIIAFTSLNNKNKRYIESKISKLFTNLSSKYAVFCRLVKGDYMECVVEKPEHSLEIALQLKTFIKSLELENEQTNKRFKYFKNYGIRLAVSIGTLNRYDKKKGIIDGEAIYMSGRKINDESTHDKKRVVIKNTFFFISKNEKWNEEFQAFFALFDFILNKATAKQCEVLFYKLQGFSEKEISKKMQITQPVVNQHSLSVGWNSIETAIKHYRQTFKIN